MWPNISRDEMIGSSYEIKIKRTEKSTQTITTTQQTCSHAHIHIHRRIPNKTNIKINGNKNKTPHNTTHTECINILDVLSII